MLRLIRSKNAIVYFFMAMGSLTLLVMLKVELPLLLGMNRQWDQKIHHYRWLLHIHAFFASVALFSAPVQFFPKFRKGHKKLHRVVGSVYAASILVSAPIGIYIALAHLSGSDKWSALVQGVLWIIFTAAAVYTSMQKQKLQHSLWAARSYALTLSFVMSRVLVDVFKINVNPSVGGNGGMVFILCVLMILAADVGKARKAVGVRNLRSI